MNLANKTFRNNKTGETIKVIDSFEDIAILENKQKASVTQLLNSDLYTEQINPEDFFNTQRDYNSLINKIKNLPDDQIYADDSGSVQVQEDPNFRPSSNESAIIQVDEESEMEALARRYNLNPEDAVKKQQEQFDQILNPEKYTDSPTNIQVVDVDRNKGGMLDPNATYNITSIDDPIITMFKNVKRSVDFSISLDIENKITRLDFIEMMEESYNTSIIEFLADEFTNQILTNPSMIKNKIIEEINNRVYGKKESKNSKISKPVKSKPAKSKSVKDKINDIEQINDIKDLKEYIKGEKSKTVLKAAEKKEKELNDK